METSKHGQAQHIVSCANNTKWNELREAMMIDWSRTPFWRAKYLQRLTQDAWELQARWDADWYYHFHSDNAYKDMEWVDIKPRTTETAISIDEVLSACDKIGLDRELRDGFVRVYGYRRSPPDLNVQKL